MTNDTLLQEPLYLSAVYWITREPINFPANNPLCFALLYSPHHLAEYRTPRHLCRAFFNEYLNDVELFALGERMQFRQLRLDRQNLFVFDISAFASVKKIFVHKS
ncbi:MAG TPA: hypothetical protein VMV62_00195 [Candidatus Paceibacterota bacterium]|nr:hypothetical protein [Candidatus Paceibacterota bacterium]